MNFAATINIPGGGTLLAEITIDDRPPERRGTRPVGVRVYHHESGRPLLDRDFASLSDVFCCFNATPPPAEYHDFHRVDGQLASVAIEALALAWYSACAHVGERR